MQTNIWRAVAIVVVVIVVGFCTKIVLNRAANQNNQVMCTMEALLCPDGSFVGRSGPKCEFKACALIQSITGTLVQDGGGFKLIFNSPNSQTQEVSYSMPLVIHVTNSLQDFVNKKVTVYGTFSTGATYVVEHLELASGGGDVTTGKGIHVGESTYINGVRITLNKITQDSRCPAGVYCIQAGWVTANVTLQSDTDKETIDLQSNDEGHPFDSYRVSIDEVKPAKVVGNGQVDYEVFFRVVSNSTSGSSGIKGSVLLGPTCPVMRNPPDPGCADKVYKTNLVLMSADQSNVVTQFSSDDNGNFILNVSPGSYAVRSAGANNIRPYCSNSNTIVVNKNSFTNITIYCDTGIR